jgi:hypothetical protein
MDSAGKVRVAVSYSWPSLQCVCGVPGLRPHWSASPRNLADCNLLIVVVVVVIVVTVFVFIFISVPIFVLVLMVTISITITIIHVAASSATTRRRDGAGAVDVRAGQGHGTICQHPSDQGSAGTREAPGGATRENVSLKVEVVSVLSAPTSQNTLHGWPPPAITTWKLLPVRAAGILKIQTALALPPASSVKVMVVNVSAATLQYTPGGSVNDAPGAAAKVWLQTGFAASAFEYALSKALCAALAAESPW